LRQYVHRHLFRVAFNNIFWNDWPDSCQIPSLSCHSWSFPWWWFHYLWSDEHSVKASSRSLLLVGGTVRYMHHWLRPPKSWCLVHKCVIDICIAKKSWLVLRQLIEDKRLFGLILDNTYWSDWPHLLIPSSPWLSWHSWSFGRWAFPQPWFVKRPAAASYLVTCPYTALPTARIAGWDIVSTSVFKFMYGWSCYFGAQVYCRHLDCKKVLTSFEATCRQTSVWAEHPRQFLSKCPAGQLPIPSLSWRSWRSWSMDRWAFHQPWYDERPAKAPAGSLGRKRHCPQ